MNNLWKIMKRDADHIYSVCKQICVSEDLDDNAYEKIRVYTQYFAIYSYIFFDLIKIENREDIFMEMYKEVWKMFLERMKNDGKEETE